MTDRYQSHSEAELNVEIQKTVLVHLNAFK